MVSLARPASTRVPTIDCYCGIGVFELLRVRGAAHEAPRVGLNLGSWHTQQCFTDPRGVARKIDSEKSVSVPLNGG